MSSSIPVIWIGNPKQDSFDGWWDMALIKDLINGELWQPVGAYAFEHFDGFQGLEAVLAEDRGAVVVIPARHWVEAEQEDRLKAELDKLPWRLLILIGDEERRFNFEQYKNDHTKIWLMQPTLDSDADFYITSGYQPSAREIIRQHEHEYLTKPLDFFFAGQVNHPRRERAGEILTDMLNRDDIKGGLVLSEGFTQGISKESYFRNMVSAKAAPAPSGIQSPDSFRVVEALESGGVPVADDLSTVIVHEPGFWNKVFDDKVPFKVFDDYDNLEGYTLDVLRDYPVLQNHVFAWWQNFKRKMSYTLRDHIKALSGIEPNDGSLLNKLTVVIPSSPIKSHPSTHIIEQTINSIRANLPDCEIIITFDGVRGEQEHYHERYNEYIKKMLWKCNTEYKNVLPILFTQYSHQVRMARKALEYIQTPTLLYVEHDCTVRTDRVIDWAGIIQCVEDGTANLIRLSHEAEVLEPHRHMFFDETPQYINGVPLLRTSQYSQRPHVASVAYYKRILTDYFSEQALTMIEDRMYGVVEQAGREDGVAGWAQHRIYLYAPGDDYKRSYTTDGREGDPKWDWEYSF